ncbi:MAG: Gfo/Idh/MocA family oxidoreductase [Verrucomicrobiae bacterium]|nr:Gfo/Idh/MocA family oxidoreductase [Verrucomicrobiae bacterium]
MAKVGIIGLGMMGQMHLAAWSAIRGSNVRMVADTDKRRAAGDFSGSWSNMDGGATSIDFSKVTGTTDPFELIASEDIDLVDICVPTPFHLDLALAAIKAGKHVLCEKPLARTAADARRIARAAEKGTGHFLPAMCLRFWPEWAWLKKEVEKGTYGKVISAHFHRVGALPPGWFGNGELSGGAILDLHLHDTDFIHHVFGMPQGVSSGGWVGSSGCVDHVHTRYLYEGGPVVTAEGSWAAAATAPFEMTYQVLFEDASADYRSRRPEAPLMLYRNGKGNRKPPEPRAVKCPGADGYQNEMRYLAECIRKGTTPEVVTPTEAAESIRIVEAETRSVLSGRMVRL